MPGAAPGRDCPLCPRLAAFRAESRRQNPDWHNAPVPAFGPDTARLLIIGLAPGLRGANRTGRPFTGDHAGRLLYGSLLKFGFASGEYQEKPDDGLILEDCRIANAVRCVPPENKPLPAETATCSQFLAAEFNSLAQVRAVLALGVIAHQAVLRALGLKQAFGKFRHGELHALPNGLHLTDSFHVSRYNTSTGRLTTEMFETVVAGLRRQIDAG